MIFHEIHKWKLVHLIVPVKFSILFLLCTKFYVSIAGGSSVNYYH